MLSDLSKNTHEFLAFASSPLTGSPGNTSSGKNCLSLKVLDGSWIWERCSVRQGYICKRRNGTTPSLPHDGKSYDRGSCQPGHTGILTAGTDLLLVILLLYSCTDFLTALMCQDPSAVLECPEDRVINIQAAYYRRHGNNICTQRGQSDGKTHGGKNKEIHWV